LSATNLALGCYASMFYGCAGLTDAPALTATTLAPSCYYDMFRSCTGLTVAPALPATNLAMFCYYDMFRDCTALTRLPALPATTLTNYCYAFMFYGCTALTRLPALPATNLASFCYGYMFYGTGIELNTEDPGTPWGIPADAMEASNWNSSMFTCTSGTFKDAPEIGKIYYLVAPGYPEEPRFATDGTALVFDDAALAIKIVNAQSGVWYTLYAVDDLVDGIWAKLESVYVTKDGDHVFTMPRDPTVPRRFFKVVAGLVTP